MEKDSECISAVYNSLLSQSYNDGIEKIVGREQDSPIHFQLPQQILEKREASWNGLFKKYSTMTSEFAFNIRTLESVVMENMQQVVEESIEPRLPLRKSMSMVQYWVDTGNQPYMINVNNRTHSDSGSSLAEEEILGLDEAVLLPAENINSSPEKQSEIVGVSDSKLMRIVSSSSSSVDTAVYILANNNTTKKADTLAIVEGSKLIDKKQNDSLESLNVVNSVNSVKKSIEKHFISKNTRQTRNNISKVSHLKENVVNKTNGSQDFDLDRTKILNEDSNIKEATGLPSIMVNESDESVFKSRYSSGLQRKKLYNNTESPAEFTPASEADSGHKVLRSYRKQYEHPAFQTPKFSRMTYLVKKCRQKFRRKKNCHLLSQISFSKTNINKSSIKDNSATQTSISKKSKIQNSKDKSKINFIKVKGSQNKSNKNLNSKSLDNSNNDSISVQQPLDRRKNSDVNKSLDYSNRFGLKTVFLTLHRLPYRYENAKADSSETINSGNKIQNQKEKKRLLGITKNEINQLNIASSDYELSDDSYHKSTEYQKRCTQSPIKKDNLKIKLKKVLTSKEKENNEKGSITNTTPVDYKKSKSDLENVKAVETTHNNILVTSQNKSPIAIPNKDKNKILFDKSVKYVPVVSSSDESEIIISVFTNKLRKRSLKRKAGSHKNSDDNSEHEMKKLLLNSNRKKSSFKLKSTELKHQEFEKANTFNPTVEQETILSSAGTEQISSMNKKLVNSKMKKINSKNTNSVISCSAKKNVQGSTDSLFRKKEQVSAEIESLNQNKIETINGELTNKVKSKLNNGGDLRDSFFIEKHKNNAMQSYKSHDKETIDTSEKNKLTISKKSEQFVQSKEETFDEDCQDLRDINSYRKSGRKFKRVTTKGNKLSLINSKIKTDEIVILSDDECIIPLKMKAQKD